MKKKSKKENKNLIIGIIIGIAVIVLILIIYNSAQNKIVCNSPYIQVGTECCLDKDYNNVCDSDEEVIEEEELFWELSDLKIDGGVNEDFIICSDSRMTIYNFNNLRDISSKNIEMSRQKYDMTDPKKSVIYEFNDYQTAVLVVWADFNEDLYGWGSENREGVTCEIEEYYDNVFNEINTNVFEYDFGLPEDVYGFSITLLYELENNPSQAKYIISCKGDTSEKEFKRTFRFNIDYVEKIGTLVC